MDHKTYLLIELTLFTGGSIAVIDERGELVLVITGYPETD